MCSKWMADDMSSSQESTLPMGGNTYDELPMGGNTYDESRGRDVGANDEWLMGGNTYDESRGRDVGAIPSQEVPASLSPLGEKEEGSPLNELGVLPISATGQRSESPLPSFNSDKRERDEKLEESGEAEHFRGTYVPTERERAELEKLEKKREEMAERFRTKYRMQGKQSPSNTPKKRRMDEDTETPVKSAEAKEAKGSRGVEELLQGSRGVQELPKARAKRGTAGTFCGRKPPKDPEAAEEFHRIRDAWMAKQAAAKAAAKELAKTNPKAKGKSKAKAEGKSKTDCRKNVAMYFQRMKYAIGALKSKFPGKSGVWYVHHGNQQIKHEDELDELRCRGDEKSTSSTHVMKRPARSKEVKEEVSVETAEAEVPGDMMEDGYELSPPGLSEEGGHDVPEESEDGHDMPEEWEDEEDEEMCGKHDEVKDEDSA